MRPDLLLRLLPFSAAFVAAYLLMSRPPWLGLAAGQLGVQLVFGLAGAPLMFVAAVIVQLWLARRRGALSVPAKGDDAWFQAGFYVLNGPIEEAFFRGLIQGGLGALPRPGFLAAAGAAVIAGRVDRAYRSHLRVLGPGALPSETAAARLNLPPAHREVDQRGKESDKEHPPDDVLDAGCARHRVDEIRK